ncbi:TPA: hypothetical protein DCE37_14505, partial [Candidatus Latescibacteria bacterium]|nr:hypothetical protein [Candidatus Latescibacterota bacterium]
MIGAFDLDRHSRTRNEQQSNNNNSLFLQEYRSHNLSYVVERFSQLLASLKSPNRYDYIIVDYASALDDIGLAAAILSPFVVVASEADDISFEAMDETLATRSPSPCPTRRTAITTSSSHSSPSTRTPTCGR